MSDGIEFLDRAVDLAVDAGTRGNRPFGAVLVAADGTVLAEGRNEVDSTEDVSAHAELVALRQATAAGHADRLTGSVMYASGEPCPMCAAACVWAGVVRIEFAASTAAFAPLFPDGPSFTLTCAEVVAASNATVLVQGPLDESETVQRMREVLTADSHTSMCTDARSGECSHAVHGFS